MFINIITNVEGNKERLFPISSINSISYGGKNSITVYFTPNANGKCKSRSYAYPSSEFAKEQYERIKKVLE